MHRPLSAELVHGSVLLLQAMVDVRGRQFCHGVDAATLFADVQPNNEPGAGVQQPTHQVTLHAPSHRHPTGTGPVQYDADAVTATRAAMANASARDFDAIAVRGVFL